jgi:hypothetical protein
MTKQSGTLHRWDDTKVFFVVPKQLKLRRKLFLDVGRRVDADDVVELREIAMGINEFADITASSFPNTIILTYTDPKVSDNRMRELKDWLIYFAKRHCCELGNRLEPPQDHTLEPAMAVHSSVGRFNEYDR